MAKSELKKCLYNILDVISEYHEDVRPLKRDSLATLTEKYFYWVTEYNDGYFPDDDDDLEPLREEFEQYIKED